MNSGVLAFIEKHHSFHCLTLIHMLFLRKKWLRLGKNSVVVLIYHFTKINSGIHFK